MGNKKWKLQTRTTLSRCSEVMGSRMVVTDYLRVCEPKGSDFLTRKRHGNMSKTKQKILEESV